MKPLLRLLALITFCAVSSTSFTSPEDVRGGATSSVEELANDLRKEGFQWRFIGRRMIFRATVLTGGPVPTVRIDGMEKDKLDTATIHHLGAEFNLKPGEKVRLTGMIVDQAYGVWQIWCYQTSRIEERSAK